MNQSVQTRLEFNESTVLFQLNDFTSDDLINLVILIDNRPGFRSRLLETE